MKNTFGGRRTLHQGAIALFGGKSYVYVAACRDIPTERPLMIRASDILRLWLVAAAVVGFGGIGFPGDAHAAQVTYVVVNRPG